MVLKQLGFDLFSLRGGINGSVIAAGAMETEEFVQPLARDACRQ